VLGVTDGAVVRIQNVREETATTRERFIHDHDVIDSHSFEKLHTIWPGIPHPESMETNVAADYHSQTTALWINNRL